MEFIDLYLQSQTHKVLSMDIKSNMLNHSYLISSKDDLLRRELCFFVAKEICCTGIQRPCNKCNNCLKISHGNMVDLEVYPKDEKSLVVEDIANIVRSSFVRPMDSEYKIFLLNNFDECTVQGQNKLLKTLEEPPQNVIFILSVKNIGQVLPTILSRSKKIEEPILSIDTITKFLEDRKVVGAKMIAGMSDGQISNAINIAENKDALSIINLALDTLKNFRSTKELLDYSSKILALKKEIPFFLDSLISILRDVSVFGSTNELYFENFKNDYVYLSKEYTKEMIAKITAKINEIFVKQEFNCNMTGVVDQLLLDILEVKFLCQK